MPWIKPSWAPGGWRRCATGIDQREFRHLLTLTVASMGAGPAARISDCAIGLLPTGAHEKDRVWQLLAENKLPETIASWTSSHDVARYFKGGVPPEPLKGG